MAINQLTWNLATVEYDPPLDNFTGVFHDQTVLAKELQDALTSSGAMTLVSGGITPGSDNQYAELRIGLTDLYFLIVATTTDKLTTDIVSDNHWSTNASALIYRSVVYFCLCKNPTGSADPFGTVGIWSDFDAQSWLFPSRGYNDDLNNIHVAYSSEAAWVSFQSQTTAFRCFGAGYTINNNGEKEAALISGGDFVSAFYQGVADTSTHHFLDPSGTNTSTIPETGTRFDGGIIPLADSRQDSYRRSTSYTPNVTSTESENALVSAAIQGYRVLRQVYFGNKTADAGIYENAALQDQGVYLAAGNSNADALYLSDN